MAQWFYNPSACIYVCQCLQIRPELVKQIAMKIVSAALAADKPASASSAMPATFNTAAAQSALLHASSGQLRHLLRELQRLKRAHAAQPQLCPDQQPLQQHQQQRQAQSQQPQQQQLLQGRPETSARMLLPVHSPQQPQLHGQLSRVQDQQLLSQQPAHGKLCWGADSLPGFAVSAFDVETDAYLIPVSHIGELIEPSSLAGSDSNWP